MINSKVLYHASQITGLDMLKPANQTPRYAGECDYIFATPFKAVAAMFLAPREISTEISKYAEYFVIFINSSPDEYKKFDKGGSIYSVDGNQFTTNSSIGMGDTEWVCDHDITPLFEETYESSLLAMNLFNVQTYFVDEETFINIQNDPSNGINLVNKSS